jgi:hypothetical protein
MKGWICPNCFCVMSKSDPECVRCGKSVHPNSKEAKVLPEIE